MTKYNIKIVREFCESIGVKLLSTEYKHIKANLLFRCPLCGKDYRRTFNNILNRKNPLCQSCSKRISQSKRFSYEDVKNFIESQGCKLISSSYINVDSPLEIQCRCGNKYIRTFYKFKNGNRDCAQCSLQHKRNKLAIPEDEIIRRLNTSNYTLLDREFIGRDQMLTIKCDHGHIYKTRLNKFVSGRRCPKCNRSTGEKRISNYLLGKGIDFKEEYSFEDLRGTGNGRLRFDFAVFEKGKLKCLIEYDGKQHFEDTPIFSDNKSIQYHDNLKNEYCRRNNIPLIRINYKDFSHIEKILYQQNIV